MDEADGEAAQARDVLRAVPGADAAAVLVVGRVDAIAGRTPTRNSIEPYKALRFGYPRVITQGGMVCFQKLASALLPRVLVAEI